MLAAAAIAVVVAAAAALIWWTSDARATISRPGRRSGAQPDAGPGGAGLAASSCGPPPARRPPRLSWWAGRSPPATGARSTGATRARASRAGATPATATCAGCPWVYRYAVAVYRDDRGCGQVSTLDGSTGRRGPARSSYADPAGARCPPTARRCCRPATPAWNCGARTWSGCWPTARPTPG